MKALVYFIPIYLQTKRLTSRPLLDNFSWQVGAEKGKTMEEQF